MEVSYSSLSKNGMKHKFQVKEDEDLCESASDGESLEDFLNDENYWLKCALCGKKFRTKKLLDIHMVEHGSRKNSCQECGKVFTSKRNKKMHMSIHSGERNFICEFCGQRFRLKSILHKHRLNHLPKAYKCSNCSKTFSHPSLRSIHQRSHNERKFQCDVCGKLFSQPTHLKTHMNVHNKKNFQCDDCGKYFITKGNLKLHSSVHTGENKYECEACGKEFGGLSCLKKHMLLHSLQKFHQCEECGEQYTQKMHLNNHLLNHHGIKQIIKSEINNEITCDMELDEDVAHFSCGECNDSFESFSALQNHMRLHARERSQDKSFKCLKENVCPKCHRMYATKSSLNTHLKSVHSNEKQFQCTECDRGFTRKNYLDLHMVIHTGEKKFKCNDCGKSFTQRSSLNSHMNIHRGVHSCEECGKIFGRKSYLMRHIKQFHEDDSLKLHPFEVSTTALNDEDDNDRISDNELDLIKPEEIIVEKSDMFLSDEIEENLCILVEVDESEDKNFVITHNNVD